MKSVSKTVVLSSVFCALTVTPALAQSTEITELAARLEAGEANTNYIFGTLLFLLGGFLVMWMAAGFAMLEAGMVRSKNVSMQCLKNISLYAVAGIMFWLVGYQLMYGIAEGGFLGTPGPMRFGLPDPETGYSDASDWFFQMVFCATTASIVSGALAERIKFWPFLLFTAFLTGFIYPVTGSWEWGAGWLDKRGFSDFAGSTLVHSTGGWAALAGAVILGARSGKYTDGRVNPIPGSSIPLATLGVFILWLGWFGFNGASQLAMGTIEDVSAVSTIFVNTNMAACAGVVVAVIYTQFRYGKIDVTMALNGALAGLVAITAEPLTPGVPASMLVGGTGSLLAMLAIPLLDRFRIDDVVGAIPVHLVAGIFGTLAVAFTNPDVDFLPQLTGVIAVGAFTLVASTALWFLMKTTIGIRVSPENEEAGLDQTETGVAAYPEFVTN